MPTRSSLIRCCERSATTPLTSFEPICYLVSSPQVIVVNSASPYRTLADFVAAAHAKPGELTVATVGPATTQHIGFEQFKRLANLNVTYVPYSGGAPAITALLGGHVAGMLGNYSEAVEQLNAGKLRALAATVANADCTAARCADSSRVWLQEL